MTTEQTFFLQILRDHLVGQTSSPNDSVDWGCLAAMANQQQLAGIVMAQCKDFISHDALAAKELAVIKKDYAVAVFFYANRTQVVRSCEKALSDRKIPYFIVKGPLVAKHYPVPALRTMGDIDFVVHEKDLHAANEAMIANGMKTIKISPTEQIFEKDQLRIEIHPKLIYRDDIDQSGFAAYFNQCWSHVQTDPKTGSTVLDWDFHFLFLLIHLQKHLLVSGVGFRQFYDLAVVMQKEKLNWDQIFRDAKNLGLDRFLEICLGLCHIWFGAELPKKIDLPDADFAESAAKTIFEGGVFGQNNPDRKKDRIGAEYDSRRVPKFLRPIVVSFRHVFRPYRYMCTLEYCQFVVGRKYLLPVAWFYRLWYCLFHEQEKLSSDFHLVFHSHEHMKKRSDNLHRWGLK